MKVTPQADDRRCSVKKLYFTKAEAKKVAKRRGRMQGVRLFVYRCEAHGGYHLTSQKQR